MAKFCDNKFERIYWKTLNGGGNVRSFWCTFTGQSVPKLTNMR